MWIILMSLVLGITIGIVRFLPDKFMKVNSRFQQIGVILLLFSMGASIGANKQMLTNLQDMGLKAVVFAVMTSIFSIIVVFIVTKRFLGGEKKR